LRHACGALVAHIDLDAWLASNAEFFHHDGAVGCSGCNRATTRRGGTCGQQRSSCAEKQETLEHNFSLDEKEGANGNSTPRLKVWHEFGASAVR